MYGLGAREGIEYAHIDQMFEFLSTSQFQVIDENPTIHQKAKTLTKIGHPNSGYPTFLDSCYHAIAIIHQCDLITADRRHFEKVKAVGNIKLLTEL